MATEIVEPKKTVKDQLADLNADRASEALVSATLDELTAAIEKLIQPVADKFHKNHPFISLGWELKLDINDGGSSHFIASYGSMSGHKKHTKAIREYRKTVEEAVKRGMK